MNLKIYTTNEGDNPEEKKLRQIMLRFLNSYYGGSLSRNWSSEKMLETAYGFREAYKQFCELLNYFDLAPKAKILDAGCGFGYVTAYGLMNGYDVYGYEIDENLAQIAQNLLSLYNRDPKRIALWEGEKLPYEDNTFDLINMHFVIDYISDVSKTMRELHRVLKPGRKVFIITPNYLCGFSPVCNILFFPWAPRALNRFYLKCLGRKNMKPLDNLYFLTPWRLNNIFKKDGFVIKEHGQKNWVDIPKNKSFDDRSGFVTYAGKRFSWFFRLTAKLGFYTPLIYELTKK